MTMTDIVVALVLGFVFGWVLDKGGLNRYYKIANVFRFTDLTVLRFMMSGMAVGIIGIYGLKALGLADLTAVAALEPAGNFIGGMVFGIGMAAAGMCPGTMAAGVGRGQLDYLIPGLLGFLTGGLIFGLAYTTPIIQWLVMEGRPVLAYAKIPELLGTDPTLTAFVFAEAVLIFLYFLGRSRIRRRDVLARTLEADIAASHRAQGQPMMPASGD